MYLPGHIMHVFIYMKFLKKQIHRQKCVFVVAKGWEKRSDFWYRDLGRVTEIFENLIPVIAVQHCECLKCNLYI